LYTSLPAADPEILQRGGGGQGCSVSALSYFIADAQSKLLYAFCTGKGVLLERKKGY